MLLMFLALFFSGLLILGAFITVFVYLACTISGLFSLVFVVAVVAAVYFLIRDYNESKTETERLDC